MSVLSLHTVQPVEVFWALIAVIGLGFSISNLVAAQRSIRFLKSKLILNGRVVLAKDSRLTESVRFLIQSIEVMIGALAMTLAPGPDISNLPWRVRATSFAIEYGLIGIAILTLFQSFNSFRLRRFFLTDKEESAGGNHDTH
jgi:hypothetical protein